MDNMVYLCTVWDGTLGTWVCVGVFSSEAKALEAGGLYVVDRAQGEAHLLDWEYGDIVMKYWYQDDQKNAFTRVITECRVNQRLV